MYYVIVENALEYNDEYYDIPDEGGGTPIRVYTSLSEANRKKLELELFMWRSPTIGQYLYNHVNDWDRLTKLITHIELKDQYDFDAIVFSRAHYTDEQLLEVMECFWIKFYELYSVTEE